MLPASRLFRVRSLPEEEVEDAVGGRAAWRSRVRVQGLRQLGQRRQLRQLRQEVMQLLLGVLRELVRVDAGRQDFLETLLQLLRGLLLRRRRRSTRRAQGS